MDARKSTVAELGLLVLVIASGCTQTPYELAQPTEVPTVFFKENISVDGVQWNNAFAKGGTEIFYTIQLPTRAYLAHRLWEGEAYGAIQPLPFDTTYFYSDVWVNEAGTHLAFMSTLPHPETGATDFNLWQSHKVDGTWQAPVLLAEAAAGAGNEGYPWLTDSGAIYFSVARDGSRNSDVHVIRPGEQESRPLPRTINTDAFEGDAYVSPDERFMIFAAFDREGGLGFSDLHISFNTEGSWSEAMSLGPRVNSAGYDGSPFVTPDGKHLIFTSSRDAEDPNRLTFNHYIMALDLEQLRQQAGLAGTP